MRIGILIYGLDRPLSGISRYTTELVQALIDLPNAPEIVLLCAGGAGPLEKLDVPQVHIPGCKRLPGLITLGNALLPLLARRYKLDVVHDPTGVTPFALGGGGAKTVVTVHDVIPYSYPNVSTRLDTLIYHRWLPRILPRVDGVITVSESSRQDIMRYLNISPDNIYTTVEGVNSAFKPASSDEIARIRNKYHISEPYILYIGSVEERKNLSRVLEAYARLGETTHKLVVVGAKKWKYQQINETLATLDLGDRVVFTGYVAEADLPILCSGADVFVFPSLYEGFGLPVLEAMASGTPVVTSNVSSLPEVAGDAAITVDPYDVDMITDAMHGLLTTPERQHEFAEKGLLRAAAFTWERAAQQILEIYNSI